MNGIICHDNCRISFPDIYLVFIEGFHEKELLIMIVKELGFPDIDLVFIEIFHEKELFISHGWSTY